MNWQDTTTYFDVYSAFEETAFLNKKHDPWMQRRKPDCEYASCVIMDCCHPDFWYSPFIGVEFTGQLIYDTHYMRLHKQFKSEKSGLLILKEVNVVRFVGNTKIVVGRDIPACDIALT